jgi:hypothetical protein
MGQLITVEFRQDILFAVERDDGVFVAIKPIVQSLGLDWKAQHRRLSEDPILAEGMVTMTIPSVGGAQETTCLRLDLVNGWLFTIDESRVRDEETRQRVLTYKRECYQVLFRHFHAKAAPRIAPDEEAATGPDGARVRLVTECRHTFGERAARQMWARLGLPVVPAMSDPPPIQEVLKLSSPSPREITAAA